MKSIVKYKEFILRDIDQNDAEAILEITNDPEVMKYHGISGSFLKNIDEAKEEIQWFLNLENENGKRWVIAKDAEGNNYIGDIGFFNFDKENNRIEIGFKLKKEYWNQGIISNILVEIIKWGFINKKYNRIEAIVETGNNGSKKVLKNSGFSYEGTLREYESINGNYVDIEMYSLLRKEIII